MPWSCLLAFWLSSVVCALLLLKSFFILSVSIILLIIQRRTSLFYTSFCCLGSQFHALETAGRWWHHRTMSTPGVRWHNRSIQWRSINCHQLTIWYQAATLWWLCWNSCWPIWIQGGRQYLNVNTLNIFLPKIKGWLFVLSCAAYCRFGFSGVIFFDRVRCKGCCKWNLHLVLRARQSPPP